MLLHEAIDAYKMFCCCRIVGAIYGRIVGRLMVSMFGIYTHAEYWEWMDPGAFALIGAASFFGGVTRLTLAVTVIMVCIIQCRYI